MQERARCPGVYLVLELLVSGFEYKDLQIQLQEPADWVPAG